VLKERELNSMMTLTTGLVSDNSHSHFIVSQFRFERDWPNEYYQPPQA